MTKRYDPMIDHDRREMNTEPAPAVPLECLTDDVAPVITTSPSITATRA